MTADDERPRGGRILCFGEPLVELNELPNGTFAKAIGGDVSNCAIAAARSGAAVGMATLLGQDRFGDEIAALWQAEDIDTRGVGRSDRDPTGIYFVTHDAAGHHFSYYRAGSAASRVDDAFVAALDLTDVAILHVSGISQAISASARAATRTAMAAVRARGGKVSYDTNLRLKLWPLEEARETIHAAIAAADIALPGLDDASALTGLTAPDAIADFYLGLGPTIVALTLGPEGVLIATPDDRRVVPGTPVTALDATAAGDTFDGAFLSRLVRGEDPFTAARYGNAAAALSVQVRGAVPSIPRAADVLALMGG